MNSFSTFFKPLAGQQQQGQASDRAKRDILEKIGTLSWELDESLVGRIIGNGGEKIRRLGKEFDVDINFDRKTVYGRRELRIIGEKSRAKAAKDAIIAAITGRKKVDWY